MNNIDDKVLAYDQLFNKYKFQHDTFIETGTHHGDGVQHALNLGFNKIHSVEILPDFHKECVNRFKTEIQEDKVHLYLGDSGDQLEEMLKHVTGPSLIFLDGHFHNGDPVWKELEILKHHPIKNHTIIVDDVPNYFGDGSKIKEKLLEINPNYTFAFEDSYNKGTGEVHKNHNIFCSSLSFSINIYRI